MEGLPIDLEARLNWLDKAIQECDAERERLGRERLILHGRLLEAQYLYEQSRRAPQPAPRKPDRHFSRHRRRTS